MGPPSAAPYEKAAWVLMGVGLGIALVFHLVPGLFAALLVNVVLSRLARRLAGRRLSHGRAKWLAAVLAGGLAVGVVTGVVLFLAGLVRGQLGDIPALFQKMADVLDETRGWLERRGGGALLPEALRNTEDLQGLATGWLRSHAAGLRKTGGELGRALLHVAFGTAIGVLVFFHPPGASIGPLGQALAERARRLAEAFEAVVFAQVKISALNSALTAVYLLLILPLAGVHLPFAGTLVAVTFLTGLLPVFGNLLSNTVIVVISLGVAGWVAAASLGFLIGIHKLEYFANARIVGGQIRASAWELLIALVGFEAVFGVPGLVMAPILYAYTKRELTDRGLV